MKLNLLHAAAFVIALTTSSAQAHVIFDVITPTTPSDSTEVSYGPQTSISATFDGWGDLIGLGGTARHLTDISFWLSTNLSQAPDLGVLISKFNTFPWVDDLYEDALDGSWSSNWNANGNGNFFKYTFTFLDPVSVSTNQINYLLVLDSDVVDELVSDSNKYLNIAISTPTVGSDVNDALVNTGDYPSGAVNQDPLDAGKYTIATEINAVPEPATLALFGLGLVGLGYARRKTAS